MKKYNLYHGDHLQILPTFEANAFDLTVTSPPYDNLRTYGADFDADTFNWRTLIQELYRVTKPGGVVVWVVADATIDGSETGTSFKQALYAMKCGFNLHDTMIYSANKAPLQHNRYENHFEYMFVWSKGKPATFNPIRVPSKYHGIDRRKNGVYTHNSGYCKEFENNNTRIRNGAKRKPVKETKIKNNIWHYDAGGGFNTPVNHPAPFPEQLARDHIISWSNPGDHVLDPMLGSGRTGRQAILLNRRFTGIELDKEYYDEAAALIKNTAGDHTLTPAEMAAGKLSLFDWQS